MTTWREKAAELLPELADELAESETPMYFWIEVWMAFEKAYTVPPNYEFIERVYEFADWSERYGEDARDAGHDLWTCVAVCFYEHLPTNPAMRADMPKWFTRQEVLGMKEILTYHASETEYRELLDLYDGKVKEAPYRKLRKGKPRHAS